MFGVVYIAVVAAGLAFLLWLTTKIRSGESRRSGNGADQGVPPDGGTNAGHARTPIELTPNGSASSDAFKPRLYAARARLRDGMYVARPDDLVEFAAFRDVVAVFTYESGGANVMLDYVECDDALLSWTALVALSQARRDPEIERRVLGLLNRFVPWTRHFILRTIEAWSPDDPLLAGTILVRLDATWAGIEMVPVLEAFLRRRAAVAPLTLAGVERPDGFDAAILHEVLRRVDPQLAEPIREQLGAPPPHPAFMAGPGFPPGSPFPAPSLEEMGHVWKPGEVTADDVIPHAAANERLERVILALTGPVKRSVLVVGEAGAGKTALIRRAEARLSGEGWTLFEASAAQINAGMSLVGMLEARIQRLRALLARPRWAWVVPDVQQLLWAGRAASNPVGMLELILPAVESGEMLIVGEIRPAALERLLLERPEVGRMFEIVRIEPPPADELAALLDAWAALVAGRRGVEVPRDVRDEARSLASQYLSAETPPGGVLRLLDRAVLAASRRSPHSRDGSAPRDASHAGAADGAPPAHAARYAGIDDLVDALVALTGLPADVLDERRPLDLDAVRRRFESRVIGQDEAVGCLVERLALIKAGVTDPGRPYGVFLFAGGTGTGKTELARTLADYLFGSPERLVRVDMSELQDGRAMDRLLGSARDGGGAEPGNSLAERVRRQPFCVVLLDEFEKAHGQVWDVFLQVFDAGRLTDHHGDPVDFRHTIIILTSNLGTGGPDDVRLGLVGSAQQFSPTAVERAVARTFRPELFNRLDRMVVFRPLTREVMRRILRKELADAFDRRGLRRRQWAVELEESALDLLVDRGFSDAMGARPLKRALERLLLTPLARAIVNRSTPEGDQFLFVRANGERLEVEFVDPDAEAPERAALAAPAPVRAAVEPAPGGVAAILFEPRGDHAEVEQLAVALEALRARVEAADWRGTKQALMNQATTPGFWERPDRFETLGRTEYLDRIESSLRSASSLLDRLRGGGRGPRRAYPRDLVRRLAQQLFLLETAAQEALEYGPRDAFASVVAMEDDGPASGARAFADTLVAMYRSWAMTRGMRWTELDAAGRDGGPGRLVAVSGFAAYALLAPEDGLHVLERDAPRGVHRDTVRVRVALQPPVPARDGAELRRQAEAALSAAAPTPAVVRRYRESPSPLVRDAVRGWRTGRIERVLAGEFDVMPAGDR